MKEKEVKQLIKLLEKFRDVKGTQTEGDYLSLGEKEIVSCVRRWTKWYGSDCLNME